MIKFLIDNDNLYKIQKNDMVLTKYQDFVNYYEEIIYCCENNSNIIFIIQNRVIESWLKRLSIKYGDIIKFVYLHASKYLSEKWKVEIPEYINDNDIISLHLLDNEFLIKQGQTFEDIILLNYYDEIFTYEIFPINKIVDIIDCYDKDIWENNFKTSIIYKIFIDKLNKWISKSNNYIASIIKMVEKDIINLKLELMKYKVLQYYPEISKKILGDNFVIYNNIKPEISGLIVIENEISDVIKEVEYYLNNFTEPENSEDLIIIIKNLSGFLKIEFDKVLSFIYKNKKLLTAEIILELNKKFNPVKNKIQKILDDLNKYIMPKIPSIPKENFSVSEMLKWVTEEYFSYHYWAENNQKIDEDLIKSAAIFSDWLYNEWNYIKANSKKMIFNILSNNIDKFLNEDRVKLFIIIDNLGWKYLNYLKDSFSKIGFILNTIDSYITMIPSETEIAKKCLLSGIVSYNDIDDKKYKSIVEEGWIPFSQDIKQFHYISSINKLNELESIKNHTYIINYLPIDKTLHQNEDEIGSSYEEKIIFLIDKIVENISLFINKNNLQEKIDIHITSDHGSTKIDDKIKNDIETSSSNSLINNQEQINARYIKLSDKDFINLNDNIKFDCYVIDKNLYGNPYHYLCAKGYNRFIKNISGYSHGGLSPEEMIIPYLHFSYIKLNILNIELFLTKKELRLAPQDIEFEISNPNIYSLENIYIKILNPNIESDSYFIDWIGEKKKMNISIKAKINKSPNKEHVSNINISVSFSCNGKEYSFNSIIPITIKSMMKTTTNLDF